MTNNEYDVVVWGATGMAGRLVARYLTSRYGPDELSIALGGRNVDRLESLEATLTDRADDRETIPIVEGDATQPETLSAIAEQTRVVCTTVGPYTTYGTPMVEACVEAGTDYCDLTGEVTWMRTVIDEFHEEAAADGTRIVNSCGFDSVPADLGTLLVQSLARERFDAPCETVRIYLEDASGGVSAGTLESIAELFETVSGDRAARKVLANPYSLAPPGERSGVDRGVQSRPRSDPLRGGWTAPSPMAVVNERVVRRSNALLEYPWGRDFQCREVIPTGSGLSGAALAAGVAGGLGLFTVAMGIDPVRSFVRRQVFPRIDSEPGDERLANGRFTVRVIGRGTTDGAESTDRSTDDPTDVNCSTDDPTDVNRSTDDPTDVGRSIGRDGSFTVESVIGADLDPGYGGTARMLGESAVCLARGETDTPVEGGVLTPASGIGRPLADRLRVAGFTVSTDVRG